MVPVGANLKANNDLTIQTSWAPEGRMISVLQPIYSFDRDSQPGQQPG